MKRDIPVLYAGYRAREEGDGSMLMLFYSAKLKEEFWFTKKGWHQIGRTYLLRQVAKGKYSVPRFGLKEMEKAIRVSPNQVEKWKVESAAAESRKEKYLARKKVNNKPQVFQCLQDAGKFYAKLKTFQEICEFENALLRELRTYRKGGINAK